MEDGLGSEKGEQTQTWLAQMAYRPRLPGVGLPLGRSRSPARQSSEIME